MIPRELKDGIQRWGEAVASRDIEERDINMRFDPSIWLEAGRLGLPGMVVPQKYGGLGLTALQAAEALEMIGRFSKDGGFNFALGAHLLACVSAIVKFGSDSQKERWLGGLSNGNLIAANALTEASSGSDAFDIESVGEKKEGEGYLLNGVKTYVTNGPIADLVLCYVETSRGRGALGGITCFVLEKAKGHFVGGENERKMGLKTCTMNKIEFKDVEILQENRIGREGFGAGVFHYSMLWERLLMPALYLGTVSRLLENAIVFCQERRSSGKSISQYQAISHKLVEIDTGLTACRLMVHRAAEMMDDGVNVTSMASKVKWYVSEYYQKAMLSFHQIYAGAAFRGSNDVERSLRASMAATIYSGPNEIQKNIIAGQMGL